MWRRAPYTASMPVPTYPADDAKSHAHSPRRRNHGLQGGLTEHTMPMIQGVMTDVSANSARKYPDLSGNTVVDVPPGFEGPGLFEDSSTYFDWLGNMNVGVSEVSSRFPATTSKTRRSRKTNTDTSMPDYASSGHGGQMSLSGDAPFTMSSFQPEDDINPGHLKVPSNTSTTIGQSVYDSEGLIPTRSFVDNC